ncbi:MAG: hypothetical protein K2J40_09590 [Ruminococcus sp.]|nr:hypothetical protein [Ruminococcus sp.]
MLNPYQYDRLYRIARKDGFDKCQEALYDACENVITAIEGDSYDELVKSLAVIAVASEKIIIALDSDYRKNFYKEVEEETQKQIKARKINRYGKKGGENHG